MKRLAQVLVLSAAAYVLSWAPWASAQEIKQIKQGSGGPTAGSNGTAALNNLTFTVPGAVLAKYATYGTLDKKVITPILDKFAIVGNELGSIDAKNIKDGAITPSLLSPALQSTIAKANDPVLSTGIQDNTIGLVDLSQGLRDTILNKPGTPGPEGAPGPQGAPGGALAYARVFANGTVDTAISKNIQMLSSAIGGIYCLRYTAGEPHIINATVDVSGADGGTTLISGTADKAKIEAAGACPATTNIQVVTAHSSTHAPQAANFYLTVVV